MKKFVKRAVSLLLCTAFLTVNCVTAKALDIIAGDPTYHLLKDFGEDGETIIKFDRDMEIKPSENFKFLMVHGTLMLDDVIKTVDGRALVPIGLILGSL